MSDYLYREARYAMNYIINGTMVEENHNHNELIRYAGIIGSRRVRIMEGETEVDEGGEIRLYGLNNVFIGRILRDLDSPHSLLFIDADDNSRKIIPQGFDEFYESTMNDPYTIEILFTRNERDPSLIGIELHLRKSFDSFFQQDPNSSRDLHVEIHSTVGLRNYYDIIIHRHNIQ